MTTVRTGSFIVAVALLCMVFGSTMAADGPRSAPPMPPGAMPPSAPAEPPLTGINPDEVMAKYGDQKLTFKEIMFFIPVPTATSAKQLVQQWLDLQMMYEAAKARGLTDDPKSKMMAELNGKQIFARELMNKVAADVNIPESQMREYYDKNKDTDPQLGEPLRLSFTHVKTKTIEEANAVKKRIAAGEDIATIAKEISIAPDAAKNEGVIKKAPQIMLERQYSKEFVDALANASEGAIIGPIKVQDGFEVARHEGKLSAKAKPFEEVAPTIKRMLEQKEKSEATQKFMENLKKESQSKMYTSPLLETPAPKADEAKSAKEPNLPVDKTKQKADNAMQKK